MGSLEPRRHRRRYETECNRTHKVRQFLGCLPDFAEFTIDDLIATERFGIADTKAQLYATLAAMAKVTKEVQRIRYGRRGGRHPRPAVWRKL